MWAYEQERETELAEERRIGERIAQEQLEPELRRLRFYAERLERNTDSVAVERIVPGCLLWTSKTGRTYWFSEEFPKELVHAADVSELLADRDQFRIVGWPLAKEL